MTITVKAAWLSASGAKGARPARTGRIHGGIPVRSFRIVIAGHGTLPAALLGTAELICGPIADIVAVGLEAGASPDRYAGDLRAAIGADHRRVLVLCDLLGGTPYNVATAIARRSPRIACLSGVNLAMTVEAALAEGDLDEALVERLLDVGRSGIVETERHRARRAS
jgi:mannose/fructose-specific phosphotransferase system component IIA